MVRKEKTLIYVLLIEILLCFIWIILFKFGNTDILLEHMGRFRIVSYDLSFKVIINSYLDILLNIIIFIPFGYILSFLTNKRIKKYIIILLVTLILEALQYIVMIGGASLLDVIANFIGGLIGVVLYTLFTPKNINILLFKIIIIILAVVIIFGIYTVTSFFIENIEELRVLYSSSFFIHKSTINTHFMTYNLKIMTFSR